jgi:hypothetical protein
MALSPVFFAQPCVWSRDGSALLVFFLWVMRSCALSCVERTFALRASSVALFLSFFASPWRILPTVKLRFSSPGVNEVYRGSMKRALQIFPCPGRREHRAGSSANPPGKPWRQASAPQPLHSRILRVNPRLEPSVDQARCLANWRREPRFAP